jgi:hypothetical protein
MMESYVTSLTERDVRNFRPLEICWTECTIITITIIIDVLMSLFLTIYYSMCSEKEQEIHLKRNLMNRKL